MVDDNEAGGIEAPQRSLVFDSARSILEKTKDVTHLTVQVPTIKRAAFFKFSLLVEVRLQEGLLTIGEGAFAQCVLLQEVGVPSTVEVIKAHAFLKCVSLTNVHLCEGLKMIGKSCFAKCAKLPRISVPSTVEMLSQSTFRGCKALVDVELKTGLHTIGPHAFYECISLTTISVPSTVNTIDRNAFGGCEALENVEIPRSVKSLRQGIFMSCVSLKRLPLQRGRNGATDPSLPFSTRTIAANSFQSCTALMQVSLSSTVDKIDKHAFSGCRLLTDVELSEGLRIIEEYAFASCISMGGVSIPSTTLKIGQYAFVRCKKLAGVEFSPKCKAKLDQGCFRHCDALSNICLPPSMKYSSGISIFTSCRALTEFLGSEGDLVEFAQDRIETLPTIHRLCYFASQTTVAELQNELSVAQDDLTRDVLDMTPFHMVATGPKLRSDLLQVLLDHYPLDHLGCMDKRGKLMMEYLVSNPSPSAIPSITMILKRVIIGDMTSWGLEDWRSDMGNKLQTIDWGIGHELGLHEIGRCEIWHKARDEVLMSLAKHAKVEVASILELALWRMKLHFAKTATIVPEQEPAFRVSCRTNCGSEVVISNVLGFYSDRSTLPLSAQAAYAAMSMMDHNLHWMEHVSPDETRQKSYKVTGLYEVRYTLA